LDQPPLELVTILEVQDSFALRLATSALDDAGIAYVVSGDDPRYFRGFHATLGVGETPMSPMNNARELLEPLANPGPVPPPE
jgi:hypothetical protein